MKRFLFMLLAAAVMVSVSATFTSCEDSKGADETTAPVTENTAEQKTDEAKTTEKTTEDLTDEALTDEVKTTEESASGEMREGSIVISDIVTVELKDGWYTKEGLDKTWNELKLENDSIDAFLANVSVKVGNVYSGQGAEYWADATVGNYNGKGNINTEQINGMTYYHVSGVVDDDTQNIYFADIDDSHYIEVAIMMMDVNLGLPAFDLISFNK